MKRVLILDAHEVVREGLKFFIETHLGESVFGEAGTARDALKLAGEQDWDAAILDSALEEKNGTEVLKGLKQIRPQLPILVLSVHSGVEYARRAFQAGAAGYITKDSPREEMVKALNNCIEGGRYVSPAIAERLAQGLERATGWPLHHALSNRELEVIRLLASGKTMGEIADLLQLSDKTVSTYRARILEKMGMRTNVEIIRYAILNELGELPSQKPKRPTQRLRNSEPSPPTPVSHESRPISSSEDALRLRVLSGLSRHMGSSGANQLLESLGDDGGELQRKVESLLQVFLGEPVPASNQNS
jgi:two-component system, NarL family, invasion response regulator UvrY